MDVGIAMAAAPPFDALARRVSRLAEMGFASFWWPDHLVAFHSRELWVTGGLGHVQPDPNAYADPFVCIAAAAPASEEALLGVCVTDAIRRSAATLLQTVMTLDHLAPGRVVLGLGAGELANWAPYGITVRSPATVLEQAAAQIRRFLDDPGPDEHGAVAGLRPPAGSRGPQLWLAAHGPRGFAATGRYADGWIPNWLTTDAWHAGRDEIASSARGAGRDPDSLVYGLSAQMVLQADHESAHRLLEHPVLKAFALLLPPERYEAVGATHPLGAGGLHKMVATRMGAEQLEAAATVPFEVVHDLMLHGTAGEVADRLSAYDGVDHVVVWDPVPLADLGAGRASAAAASDLIARLSKGR